jgi:AcrR family transcriptional regulator
MNQRIQQTDRTRNAIIEAATEIIFGTASPETFTMQNIADAAGVSHRTLYRYFANREELINAVGSAYDQRLESAKGVPDIGSFDRWTGSVEGIIAFGAAHRDLLQRALGVSIVTGQWRTDRDTAYWEMFRERFPHLGETEAREDFALLRHVLWSTNAVLVGQRFNLTPQGVAAGVERAVLALVASIAERDEAAATKGEEQ